MFWQKKSFNYFHEENYARFSQKKDKSYNSIFYMANHLMLLLWELGIYAKATEHMQKRMMINQYFRLHMLKLNLDRVKHRRLNACEMRNAHTLKCMEMSFKHAQIFESTKFQTTISDEASFITGSFLSYNNSIEFAHWFLVRCASSMDFCLYSG